MMISRSHPNMVVPLVWWCRISTSGKAPNGFVGFILWKKTDPVFGKRRAITTMRIRGKKNAIGMIRSEHETYYQLANRVCYKHKDGNRECKVLYNDAAYVDASPRGTTLRYSPNRGRWI